VRGAESADVLAWVFRNRVRVAAIYGCVEPPPLAGRRFAAGARGGGAARGAPRHGAVRRVRASVELAPMPARIGELERRR
jgi:hypothetical protein